MTDALAYLRKNASRFQKLKNPKKAELTLQLLEDNRTQTLEKISEYMNSRYLEKYKNQIIGFDYLNEDQKVSLDKMVRGMMGRFMDVAGIVMTHEETAEEKKSKTLPPNVISLGTTEGVYSLMDLNMYFNTNIPSLVEQAKRANSWFVHNLWMQFIVNRGQLGADTLTLPVFKTKKANFSFENTGRPSPKGGPVFNHLTISHSLKK